MTPLRRTLQKIRSATGRAIPTSWVVRSPLLTSLYLHFKGVYRAEQSALLAGITAYDSDVGTGDPYFQLRRNVHRIEKGLSSIDRRRVFAESYILETVRAYRRVADRRESGDLDPTVKWARDVLDAYFGWVGSTPAIEAARFEFGAFDFRRSGGAPHAPYSLGEITPAVGTDELSALAHQRVSVRNYRDEPVSREKLEKALEIAMQSPSACNRVPYFFRFYDDDEVRPRLTQLAPGTAGWAHTAPVICALTGQYRAYFHVRDRHAIYVDASLAAMAFQLALVTMGLGSCSVNWPQLAPRETAARELLGLAPDEKIVMLITIGHPAESGIVPYSAKRSLDELRSFNQ